MSRPFDSTGRPPGRQACEAGRGRGGAGAEAASPEVPPRPPSAHIPDDAVAVVPPEMVQADRWVAWEWKWKWKKRKADGGDKGKWDKPPIDPATGIEVDAKDPAHWMAFE